MITTLQDPFTSKRWQNLKSKQEAYELAFSKHKLFSLLLRTYHLSEFKDDLTYEFLVEQELKAYREVKSTQSNLFT